MHDIGTCPTGGGVVQHQHQALMHQLGASQGRVRWLEGRLEAMQRLLVAIREYPSVEDQIRAIAPEEWDHAIG